MSQLVVLLLIALFLFLRTRGLGRLKGGTRRPMPRDADPPDLRGQEAGDSAGETADSAVLLGLPPLTRGTRTDAVDPLAVRIEAGRKAAARIEGHRGVKYLLDGDGRSRRSADRVARIQRMVRGKGLCSPR